MEIDFVGLTLKWMIDHCNKISVVWQSRLGNGLRAYVVNGLRMKKLQRFKSKKLEQLEENCRKLKYNFKANSG